MQKRIFVKKTEKLVPQVLLRRMILGQPVPDARLYSPEEVEQSRQTPFES